MGGPATSTLRCEDGTEIPFEWVFEGADQFEWVRERAHQPNAQHQMDLWMKHDETRGADRAWEEVGLEAPPMFHRTQFAGPFLYMRGGPPDLTRIAKMTPRYEAVARQHAGIAGFWRDYCEPRIKQVCEDLAATPAGASLRDVAELRGYCFHQTFTSVSLLVGATMRLTMLLAERAGEDAMLMAYEVTQGGENASQVIDAEIWELARIARKNDSIRRILDDVPADDAIAALRAAPAAAAAFVAAFDALIERHGSRSLGWDIALPTWRERPEAALALIRAQLGADAISPADMTARSDALRAAATERALAMLPAERHDEFNALVASMDGYVRIREDRAYWQMRLTGEVRGFLLRTGADLVAQGRIDPADDILFLVPDDFAPDTPSDLRGLVAERRREWQRWSELVPPAVIGTPSTPQPVVETPPAELRGAPASRGEVTGIARILHSPEEGARLRAGDVLVCVMTTPAWTPLFSIAGGIVTETGGALSHPAITAREYGIPAVVAVPGATTRIRDGQTVTLDGGKGIITLRD